MGEKYIVEIENRREQGWYRIKDLPDDWFFDETYLQKLQVTITNQFGSSDALQSILNGIIDAISKGRHVHFI